MQNWRLFLIESRFKGFEKALKNKVFPHLPDLVFNDMYGHEGVKDYAVDRTDDINKIGLEKFFKTDEYAKEIYDRYDLTWTKNPVVLDLKWEDLSAEERKFLMDKHLGLNPNFPMDQYQQKIHRTYQMISDLSLLGSLWPNKMLVSFVRVTLIKWDGLRIFRLVIPTVLKLAVL